MKVIKLNNRYKLFRRGYTHAVISTDVQNSYAEMRRVENAARDLLGDQYANCYDPRSGEFNGPWTSGNFKRSNRNPNLGFRTYVAVKREQDLVMIILKAQV